ncbi:GNAT family N-acetyltransferase [Variovorax paradoxus]|uniref:GNAT family N-acetyltransferase n=1 Tax=Variovorax paradoxus TaxID=34073 RepID=UPI00386F182A
MTLRVLRASARHAETLRALHTLTFPHDDHEDYTSGYWWIVWDGDAPVAFAGMRCSVTAPATAYLSRCGVLKSHRGLRLQPALLRRRLTLAKREGFQAAISTTYLNTPSANNLIRAGFRLYDPEAPWGALGTCYWRRELPLSAKPVSR